MATLLQNSMLNTVAGDAGTLVVSDGAVLGGLKGNGDLSLAGNSISVSIGNNNQSTTYSGVLSNTALNKIGTGMLTLSGLNTFSGGVTVSAGTLSVGVLAANGANSNLGAGTSLTLNGGTLPVHRRVEQHVQPLDYAGRRRRRDQPERQRPSLLQRRDRRRRLVDEDGRRSIDSSGATTLTAAKRTSTRAASRFATSTPWARPPGRRWWPRARVLSVGGGLTGTINEPIDLNGGGDGSRAPCRWSIAGTDVTFAGTINLASASVTIGGTSHFAISGNVVGASSLLKYGSNRVDLLSASDFTGDTRVATGTLAIASNSLQYSTLSTVSYDTGTLVFGDGVVLGGLKGNRNLSLAGNSTCVSIGNNNQSTLYSGVLSNAAPKKIGTGTLTFTGANTYTGLTTVAGGTLELGPSAQNCVFNLGGADIQSGKMVFDYAGSASPATTIEGLLNASYDGGLWDVGQFRDSTAAATGLTLGCLDDGSGHVTVMATYPGDFNLDGVVDSLDRDIWFANAGTGTTWQQGDANYDGTIDGLDREPVVCACRFAAPCQRPAQRLRRRRGPSARAGNAGPVGRRPDRPVGLRVEKTKIM